MFQDHIGNVGENARVRVVATYDNPDAAERECARRQDALERYAPDATDTIYYRVTPWARDMYYGTLAWDVEAVYTFATFG